MKRENEQTMILGTYWYFKFPTGLYQFDYFKFNPGYGGHVDNPAELSTTIETNNAEQIISALKSLIAIYNEGCLFIYQDHHNLKIEIGGYQLFDYDFLLAAEVEKILRNNNIKLSNDQKLNNAGFLKISSDNNLPGTSLPKKGILQVVGSDFKKYNAENSKLRLDCHLNLNSKEKFIADLKAIAIEENLRVLFYFDNDFDDKTNLMIFFTNGRQGLDLTGKQFIDAISFENKIEKTMLAHNVQRGHINAAEFYPKNGPHSVMMIEESFIL